MLQRASRHDVPCAVRRRLSPLVPRARLLVAMTLHGAPHVPILSGSRTVQGRNVINHDVAVAVTIATGLWLLSRAGGIVRDTVAAASRSVQRGTRLADAVLEHAVQGAGRMLLLRIGAAALAAAIWIAMRMPTLLT